MAAIFNYNLTLKSAILNYNLTFRILLNSARRIHFFVFCNEEWNYENYVENSIRDKECSVCYKSHKGIISNYRIKARQFLFRLKLDYFQNYRPK